MAAARTGEKTDPAELLAQLATAREQFRTERERHEAEVAKEWAGIADEKAELDRRTHRVQKQKRQAELDREKARLVYRRYLKRMRVKWSAERKSVDMEREELTRDRANLSVEAERIRTEHQRQTDQLTEYKSRLTAAWELLAENQRRLLTDRQQAESWLAQRTETAERQQRMLDDRASREADTIAKLEERVTSLLTEIAGLEARAANARAALRHLEQMRSDGGATSASAANSVEQLAVALEPQRFHPAVSQEADRLLADLNESTQAAAREKVKLAAAREQLDREAGDLADQRAVLAEQVATLAAARDLWRSSEHTTVVELEHLAHAVRGREQQVEERERGLMEAERERRQREYDLWQLRVKLEGWQAALAAHESAAAADRDRADTELTTRREHLSRWEASLEKVQRAWAGIREKEKQHLATEMSHWADARQKLAQATTEIERVRSHYVAEAEKLAAQLLTSEEQAGAEPRRVRVIRKRWESHFGKVRKELDARTASVKADLQRADERWDELQDQMNELIAKQTEAVEQQLAADRDRIAADHDESEPVVTISIEEARRKRGEVALTELRTEIERLSSLLLLPSSETEIVPLVLKAA